MPKQTRSIQRTQAKESEEYLRLRAFLVGQPPGAVLTYIEVGVTTGVAMNNIGKAKLKRAIDRSGLECSAIRHVGYKLADSTIAMPILSYRLHRVDRQAKRAERAQKIIQGQFFADLSAEEQRGVLFLGAVFGAIRVAAENGRALYDPKVKSLPAPESIPLPRLDRLQASKSREEDATGDP